ncbi:hypothetical protein [Streptomyces sp. KMM 9044]|uniref:hypothetical protein n=1 Tax=Streptomyces sp. KMM 9044 TaxID=2744474 RepID=UPI00215199AD|nr:hypothetical protein [Streptomyces sp. KMM 9044]WAX76390.1 hypothetical protein HUV60_000470 [Streptomyces sp. KMM 9044]
MILLALVALPLVLARVVFRSGRHKGSERLTAAVPAALTLFGSSVVPFAGSVPDLRVRGLTSD